MTIPAQEAKEFAVANGFSITAKGRRYVIADESKLAGKEFAEVGGYPAALNAMKRHLEQAQKSADAVKLGEAIGKDQLQQCARFNHVALSENAPDPACKVAPAGWDKVETSVEDWSAGKVNHPFTPAAAPRAGWYVRVTATDFVRDIPCYSMKHAYHVCASAAQFFKRIGHAPSTKRSVIFKRGA